MVSASTPTRRTTMHDCLLPLPGFSHTSAEVEVPGFRADGLIRAGTGPDPNAPGKGANSAAPLARHFHLPVLSEIAPMCRIVHILGIDQDGLRNSGRHVFLTFEMRNHLIQDRIAHGNRILSDRSILSPFADAVQT